MSSPSSSSCAPPHRGAREVELRVDPAANRVDVECPRRGGLVVVVAEVLQLALVRGLHLPLLVRLVPAHAEVARLAFVGDGGDVVAALDRLVRTRVAGKVPRAVEVLRGHRSVGRARSIGFVVEEAEVLLHAADLDLRHPLPVPLVPAHPDVVRPLRPPPAFLPPALPLRPHHSHNRRVATQTHT